MEYMNTWNTKAEAIFRELPQPNSTKNSKTYTSDQTIAATASAKFEDGNIKAAAKILCSDDTPAEICDQTWKRVLFVLPLQLLGVVSLALLLFIFRSFLSYLRPVRVGDHFARPLVVTI